MKPNFPYTTGDHLYKSGYKSGASCMKLDQALQQKGLQGLPWWSSGSDPELPMQGPSVQSLVIELDPTYCN